MSDLFRSTHSWWAPSSKHAKRTAVGTTAIVVALGLITWSVWVSPSSPVATAVHQALGVKTAADDKPDAGALQTKLTAAQKQIWKLEGQLASTSAQSGSRSDQLVQLKAQIASLQSQLGSAQAVAAGKGASVGSGTPGSSSAGSSGSGTHTAGAVTKPNTGPSKDPVAATPLAVPTKQQLLTQPTRWYGLYTAQAPFNWAEYDQVSQSVGTATNMVGFFQGFDQDFNTNAVQRAWANGRVPLMTWESRPAATGNDVTVVPGYSNQDIIDGSFDAYLTRYAQALKANGQPMVIRLDHEMNGAWYNWSEGDGTKGKPANATGSYVAMWQHVHDVFQANGANDYVIWNWAPSRIDKLGNAKYQTLDYMRNYWPGADYVDWVGMSGYYRSATEQPTFANTFAATVGQLRQVAPGKKILLSEIGATETGTTVSGGQKAKWFTSLFDALARPENDDVIGFSYFSEVATTVVDNVRSTNDWRLNSRADSLQAFADGIKRTDIDYDLQEVTK